MFKCEKFYVNLHFTMMGKNKPKPAWKVFSICVQLETVGNINPLIWYGHVEIKKNEFKINKILHEKHIQKTN